MKEDIRFMRLALEEAQKAAEEGGADWCCGGARWHRDCQRT